MVDLTNFVSTSPDSDTIVPDQVANFKSNIQNLLRTWEAKITFTKKDGTERVMHCTLKEGVVVPHEKTTDRVKQPKDDLLSVWDIEAQGWRTVNVPTISVVEIIT
jgi:hypothetical protein